MLLCEILMLLVSCIEIVIGGNVFVIGLFGLLIVVIWVVLLIGSMIILLFECIILLVMVFV